MENLNENDGPIHLSFQIPRETHEKMKNKAKNENKMTVTKYLMDLVNKDLNNNPIACNEKQTQELFTKIDSLDAKLNAIITMLTVNLKD